MADVRVFAEGGYRYIKAVFQYSGGVAAQPGFEIERALLPRPLPLAEGFAAIKAHLARLGRPLSAFCACELRSPAPFTEEGFKELNLAYAKVLEEWGIYRQGENPVARSNVCPAIAPPAAVSFYAFSYTVPGDRGSRTNFVIAGGAECPEGRPNYRDFIVARGDTSAEGLRSKHVNELISQDFDYVITVCDNARETCPVFPRKTKRLHWSFPDPSAVKDPGERRRAFREVAAGLRERIAALLGLP